MEPLIQEIDGLKNELNKALDKISITEKVKQLSKLEKSLADPEIWKDSSNAAELSKTQTKIKLEVDQWIELKSDLDELSELASMRDESLTPEIVKQLQTFKTKYSEIKKQLRFNGPYDRHDAILSIYAGAGGTDAQDWAQMLLRMYLRFFEKQNFKVSIIDESAGDEAGIKSVTLEVEGSLVYGKLKNEHGVHRLVRLSPFNSDNLRQTSFAKVDILPKIDRPDEVEIDDKDLKIDVFRAGGHGGQSVNTTDSAVRVTHLPTGIVVSIQNERSQIQNKETALTILRSKLIQLQSEQHLEKLADLKGVNQSAEWGNQIRNYVLHPYKMVKDLRSNIETSDTDSILDGNLDIFIESF